MSCVATNTPTLMPLVIPAAFIVLRVAPVVWRTVVAAQAKRAADSAQARAWKLVTTTSEKPAPAIDALPALT